MHPTDFHLADEVKSMELVAMMTAIARKGFVTKANQALFPILEEATDIMCQIAHLLREQDMRLEDRLNEELVDTYGRPFEQGDDLGNCKILKIFPEPKVLTNTEQWSSIFTQMGQIIVAFESMLLKTWKAESFVADRSEELLYEFNRKVATWGQTIHRVAGTYLYGKSNMAQITANRRKRLAMKFIWFKHGALEIDELQVYCDAVDRIRSWQASQEKRHDFSSLRKKTQVKTIPNSGFHGQRNADESGQLRSRKARNDRDKKLADLGERLLETFLFSNLPKRRQKHGK